MNVVGIFRESQRDADQLKSIHDYAGLLPREHKRKVLSYLRGAPCVFEWMRGTLNPFQAQRTAIPGGADQCCDGEWIWRSELIDLVQHYDVVFPAEFLQYIVANKGFFRGDADLIRANWAEVLRVSHHAVQHGLCLFD